MYRLITVIVNCSCRHTQVYVIELIESIDLCVERNIHHRTREEIQKVVTCASAVVASLLFIRHRLPALFQGHVEQSSPTSKHIAYMNMPHAHTHTHTHTHTQLAQQWEETPPHFTRLDVTSLLSDSNIDEV